MDGPSFVLVMRRPTLPHEGIKSGKKATLTSRLRVRDGMSAGQGADPKEAPASHSPPNTWRAR